MADVFLTSCTSPEDKHGRLELGFLQESASSDCFGIHSTTDDPNRADLLLFVEREEAAGVQQEHVLAHPLYQSFKEKAFVVNPRYKGVPQARGVYASIPHKWYDRSLFRSGHYLEVVEDRTLRHQGDIPNNAFLYSFRGKIGTASVRKGIVDLNGGRGVVQSTDSLNFTPKMQMEASSGELQKYRSDYISLVKNSKFVLCPRGVGPASLRLFETMLMGRVPVIIADQWVPPKGPDWGSISIRIAEADIAKIPNLLGQREEDASNMGARARHTWDNWFSSTVTFHRIVEQCLEIQNTERTIRDTIRTMRRYTNNYHIIRKANKFRNRIKKYILNN